MNYLKKFGFVLVLVAFCLSLYVATTYAQPGRAGWKNRKGNSYGWTRGQRNGWDNGRKRGWRNRNSIFMNDRRWRNRNDQYIYYPQTRRRYRSLSAYELWQMRRQRARIYNSRSRYYYNNDGNRERRRMQNRYNRRNVYRRDW